MRLRKLCFCVTAVLLLPQVLMALSLTGDKLWVRPAQKGQTSALYGQFRQDANQRIHIVRARIPQAQVTELHTVITEVKQGHQVQKMRPVERFEVTGREPCVLKQGGNHIMLIGVTETLSAGDSVTLELELEHASGDHTTQIFQVPVKKSQDCGCCGGAKK